MTAKEKMKELIKFVGICKKTGAKNNILNLQLMENFDNGEKVLIVCYDVPEFDDLTFEAWHYFANSKSCQWWKCERILDTADGVLWDRLLQGWYGNGFKQTTFVNFER